MTNKTRRSFDKSLKLMIVELHQSGKSSRDFDIHSDMVRRWSREHLSRGSVRFSGNGNPTFTGEQRDGYFGGHCASLGR